MAYEIQSKVVVSLPDFLEEVQEIWGVPILFRGQTVRRNLLPGIARAGNGRFSPEEEGRRLTKLRMLGAQLPEVQVKDPVDLLVAAQHHGMRTRLLDWTSNSLVALWFACAEENDRDGYIYALAADEVKSVGQGDTENLQSVLKRGTIEPIQTFLLQPNYRNRRVQAQSGWFSFHHLDLKTRRCVPLEDDPDIQQSIYEFVIPRRDKRKFMASLEYMGIDRRTLFPDMDGLCQYLNETPV